MGSGQSQSIITPNTRERAYGGGREALRTDLQGWRDNYYRHVNKIKGNPYDFNSILGWIRECRHSATEAFEIVCKLLDQGATIEVAQGDSVLKADRIMLQNLYQKRLAELEKFERDARPRYE